MIGAGVFDAGTRLVRVPKVVPGMDKVRFVELDFEEPDIFHPRTEETNELMRAQIGAIDVAPWPRPLRKNAAVDYTPRYADLELRLYELQAYAQAADWTQVPGGTAKIARPANYSPITRAYANASRRLNPEELRAAGLPFIDPTEWIRLPFDNEIGADLREPLALRFDGIQNRRFSLELVDQDYFTPWDLRHPERYHFLDDAGEPVENGEVFARIQQTAALNLYLRPRRWWWFAKVLVHFLHGNWFQEVYNDEIFLKVYFDTQPFYPVRHYLGLTKGVPAIWHEFEGAWLAYDQGIEWKFEHSKAAEDLRRQISFQEWFTLCEFYVYVGNEPAVVTIKRYPPRVGELVLGLGFTDRILGVERRIWLRQFADVSDVYPAQLIDVFWCDFEG